MHFLSQKYIYAYMQKILSSPALGFLYYFPIYCIVTTLLNLGWAQGFTAQISLRKYHFVKLACRFPSSFHPHQNSACSTQLEFTADYSHLKVQANDPAEMQFSHVHCPKTVNRSASLIWCCSLPDNIDCKSGVI